MLAVRGYQRFLCADWFEQIVWNYVDTTSVNFKFDWCVCFRSFHIAGVGMVFVVASLLALKLGCAVGDVLVCVFVYYEFVVGLGRLFYFCIYIHGLHLLFAVFIVFHNVYNTIQR